MSGYTHCACRDCFETVISADTCPALCRECEESGCDADGVSACCAEGEDAWDCDCDADEGPQ